MRTNLGRVSPLPRGDWRGSVTYSEGDIVRSENAVYISLQRSMGVQPGVSAMWTNYWKLIEEDGNHSDIDKLAKSLDLANSIINMSTSVEMAPYGSQISVLSSVDPEDQSFGLSFQIPSNADFE